MTDESLLVHQHLDGTFSDNDRQRLNDWINEDPDNARTFAELSLLHDQLWNEFSGRSAVSETSQAPEADPVIPVPERVMRPDADHGVQSGTGDRLLTVICVSVALGLVLWATVAVDWKSGSKPTLTIASISGQFFVTSGEGERRAATAGDYLENGTMVETAGATSLATLAFEDGSHLLITGDSVLTVDRITPKSLGVSKGSIVARITPQANGRPMVFRTPLARVDVLGTRFSIASTDDVTDVRVSQGKVRVTRESGGDSVVVDKGKRAVAGRESSDVVVESAAGLPQSWHEDFENGVPGDWRVSGFSTDDLPEGSVGAARAILSTERDDWFSIQSPSLWLDGLYQVHPDSHLNLIYRMENPGWINIFMITRNDRVEDARVTLNLFDQLETPFHAKGQWRRVAIPIASFHRKEDGKFTEKSPFVDDLCFGMMLSWFGEDRGFLIDRLWVSSGGPGKIVNNPLDESTLPDRPSEPSEPSEPSGDGDPGRN